MNPLARALYSRRDDLAALYLLAGALVTLRRERSSLVARPVDRSAVEAGESNPARRPIGRRRIRAVDPPAAPPGSPPGTPEVDA